MPAVPSTAGVGPRTSGVVCRRGAVCSTPHRASGSVFLFTAVSAALSGNPTLHIVGPGSYSTPVTEQDGDVQKPVGPVKVHSLCGLRETCGRPYRRRMVPSHVPGGSIALRGRRQGERQSFYRPLLGGETRHRPPPAGWRSVGDGPIHRRQGRLSGVVGTPRLEREVYRTPARGSRLVRLRRRNWERRTPYQQRPVGQPRDESGGDGAR